MKLDDDKRLLHDAIKTAYRCQVDLSGHKHHDVKSLMKNAITHFF